MTKRRIRSHKGGRTARAPEARMTPQERGRLDEVLEQRGGKYVDWLIDHVEADYKQITGGNDKMAEPFTSKSELVKWIHSEIASQGTSSVFWGRGLDKRAGTYDAEKIADRIIGGKLRIKNITYKDR